MGDYYKSSYCKHLHWETWLVQLSKMVFAFNMFLFLPRIGDRHFCCQVRSQWKVTAQYYSGVWTNDLVILKDTLQVHDVDRSATSYSPCTQRFSEKKNTVNHSAWFAASVVESKLCETVIVFCISFHESICVMIKNKDDWYKPKKKERKRKIHNSYNIKNSCGSHVETNDLKIV